MPAICGPPRGPPARTRARIQPAEYSVECADDRENNLQPAMLVYILRIQ